MSFTGFYKLLALGATEDGCWLLLNFPSMQDLRVHVGAIGELIVKSHRVRTGSGHFGDDGLSISDEGGPSCSTSIRVIKQR